VLVNREIKITCVKTFQEADLSLTDHTAELHVRYVCVCVAIVVVV